MTEYVGDAGIRSRLKDKTKAKHIPIQHSPFFLCDIPQDMTYLLSRNLVASMGFPARPLLPVFEERCSSRPEIRKLDLA